MYDGKYFDSFLLKDIFNVFYFVGYFKALIGDSIGLLDFCLLLLVKDNFSGKNLVNMK